MKTQIALFLFCSIFISCSHSTAPAVTSDMNLTFSYGVQARNVLNTFQNTFTKDLISAGDTTVPFIVSADDLNQILQKMNEINFFAYPDTFIVPTGDTVTTVMPFDTYYFDVKYKSSNKRLYWRDAIMNENSQAIKLRELITFIEGIIQANPEYSKLPPAKGGYQ